MSIDKDFIDFLCGELLEYEDNTNYPIETNEYRKANEKSYDTLDALTQPLPDDIREKIMDWYDHGEASDFTMVIQRCYFKAGFRRGLQIVTELFGPAAIRERNAAK